ncbi:AmiS/UreI family transporter [Glutamicibacter endophyticus]|uniref:AmiS/UreI family transporter n=1 Tax=Glutamicibacter sp. PS TaxID=3075634 RepID=UPI00284E3ABB|nr:AmiS/UreI family transporter [Glutamicibacter sp. PS]MDR4534768.1 transporter [Glutamicibacter sp. PS]
MEHVGLVFVGVILFVNGLSSLGVISAKSTVPLNFFVGILQMVLPTIVMLQSSGDPQAVAGAWPSYLFGMTYLWVGYNAASGGDEAGFGWYSLFVAAIALYEVAAVFPSDPVMSVIWLSWALAWFLFFLQLSLYRTTFGAVDLRRFTGWYLALIAFPSSTIPALLLMNGLWTPSARTGLASIAILLAIVVASVLLSREHRPRLGTQPPLLKRPLEPGI